MELKGKVTRLLPLRTGEGRNGAWKKQDFVVETQGPYPRNVCFSLWGNKVDQYPLEEGEEVTVAFDLESREYNERWYTDARAWRITKDSEGADMPPPSPPPPTSEPNTQKEGDNEVDDLPF